MFYDRKLKALGKSNHVNEIHKLINKEITIMNERYTNPSVVIDWHVLNYMEVITITVNPKAK